VKKGEFLSAKILLPKDEMGERIEHQIGLRFAKYVQGNGHGRSNMENLGNKKNCSGCLMVQ
jgi:hypothetical protein